MELISVASMAIISGYAVPVNALGPCATSILTDKVLNEVACLLGTTEIRPLNPNSQNTDCQSISTVGISLKSFNVTFDCMDGWTKGLGGVCEQIMTTTESTSGISVMTGIVVRGSI